MKVYLSLCLNTHRVMKTYGGVTALPHEVLTPYLLEVIRFKLHPIYQVV